MILSPDFGLTPNRKSEVATRQEEDGRLASVRHLKLGQSATFIASYSFLRNLRFPVASSVAGLRTILHSREFPTNIRSQVGPQLENTSPFIHLLFSAGDPTSLFSHAKRLPEFGFATLLSLFE